MKKIEVFKHKDGSGVKSGRSKRYVVKPLDFVADLELTDNLNYKELANNILNERHLIRGGSGAYDGISYDITDKDVLYNLVKLYKTRKKYEFIKLATKEIDIIIIAYQKTNDSLYVEAIFEHYFSYIMQFSKKYNYVAAGVNTDDDSDFIAESFIIVEQCMTRYKLGYFTPILRDWLRHSLSEACRKKYYDVIVMPKPILKQVREGEIDKPVSTSGSSDEGGYYINTVVDSSLPSELILLEIIEEKDKKLWNKIVEIAGYNEAEALCYTRGILTEDGKVYSCKELAAVCGVSTSTIVRRRQNAIDRLRNSEYFQERYAFYKERNIFQK
jgi:hypothetical protein